VTIRGAERVDLAALEPKPEAKAKPQAAEASAKPQAAEASAKPEANAKPEVASGEKPPVRPAPAVDAAPPAPQVDVNARLADPIPAIELPGVPLGQAVETIAGMSTLPISFDPDALQELGVTLRDPVTVTLTGSTVGKALAAIAASRKLVVVVEEGQVLITSPAAHRESLVRVRYTVSDLTGDDPKQLVELGALVQKLVAPDCWQSNGGRGTLEAAEGALVVTQTGNVHYQLLVFCEKLRTARGKPTRSRLNPDLFTLATRSAQAQAVLGREVTVNFSRGASLGEILNYLRDLTGVEFLVDRPALNAAGISDDPRAVLKVDKQSLAVALSQMLEPLGLAWRAVAANTLQITAQKAVATRLELEFYKVGELVAKGQHAALIERIKSRVAGGTWSDAGGAGILYFDSPSQCLIVLQSQPVQAALEALLAEKPN
jgi:hypothetical protein